MLIGLCLVFGLPLLVTLISEVAKMRPGGGEVLYALTNKRAIRVSMDDSAALDSVLLGDIQQVSVVERNHIGSVRCILPYRTWAARKRFDAPQPIFHQIVNPADVCRMMTEIRQASTKKAVSIR